MGKQNIGQLIQLAFESGCYAFYDRYIRPCGEFDYSEARDEAIEEQWVAFKKLFKKELSNIV